MKLLANPGIGASLTQPGYLRQSLCVNILSSLLRQRYPALHSAGLRFSGHQSSNFPQLRKEEPFIWGGDFDRSGQTPGSYCGSISGTARAVGSRPSLPPIPEMPPGVGSASLYPIKGFVYLWEREARELLWQRVAKFAAEVIAASVAVLGAITAFTFSSQYHLVLQVVPHFFGLPGTAILILVETAIPVSVLFYKRLRTTQDKLFDDVLSLQNVRVQKASQDEKEWIDEQRELQRQRSQDTSVPRTPIGLVTNPKSLNQHPVRKYFLTLPLNFIPVVGSIAFCWMNAVDTAAGLHHHYYSHLKGLSKGEEATVIQSRGEEYQQFGLMASALTLVPGVDAVLVLTNAIGAALWAADIEKALEKSR